MAAGERGVNKMWGKFTKMRMMRDAEKDGFVAKGTSDKYYKTGQVDGKEPSSFKYDKKDGTFLMNFDEPTNKTLGSKKNNL